MSRIKRTSLGVVWSSALACILAGSSLAMAEQPLIEPEAKQILKNSMLFLSSQQQFTLETQSSIEFVMESGQKIQFDNAVDVSIQRPDKLHAERHGDLVHQEFFYDGKTLTLHDTSAGYYASVEAPGTLDEMLEFTRNSLDIAAPGGDFVYTNAYELLMEDVESGFVVGVPVYLNGVECDHVAFSKPDTDFQVWIERGARPLPRKIVITSRDVLNAPQFTTHITEWNLSPSKSEQEFTFREHEKATPIEFVTVK